MIKNKLCLFALISICALVNKNLLGSENKQPSEFKEEYQNILCGLERINELFNDEFIDLIYSNKKKHIKVCTNNIVDQMKKIQNSPDFNSKEFKEFKEYVKKRYTFID